uniref:Rab-GAP TBC domain-containing protein n=1 Tax=Ditylenchus dipsaci TaxID=166011 RepID=A0A915EHI7_9BILA
MKLDEMMTRFSRLKQMLGEVLETDSYSLEKAMKKNNPEDEAIDMEQLRKDCWLGIPNTARPLAWRILCGYSPTIHDLRDRTVKQKREEYWLYVEHYFQLRTEESYQAMFRQIYIDVPRMCPLHPIFQQSVVRECFERMLFVWAAQFVLEEDLETFHVSKLSKEQLSTVEADTFWCVSFLLENIQDNYTFEQPGIHLKVQDLKEVISVTDEQLYDHFDKHGVDFLQFSFRWMNNLLMRELPLQATIRLWDTYLSEKDGFSEFHTYVCAAFLRLWSKRLQSETDFQGIMILLQNLPTKNWANEQICELTADAFSLICDIGTFIVTEESLDYFSYC